MGQRFSGLDSEIASAREAYLTLRGHLRDQAEFDALNGVYNSLKSPLRLTALDESATVDHRCESLEYMITSLHRVDDLLSGLVTRSCRRAIVGNTRMDAALTDMRHSDGFLYFDHFTDYTKHVAYIGRGLDSDASISNPSQTAHAAVGHSLSHGGLRQR